MASGAPIMNGDIWGQSGTLEETLQQMNILIQENRDLKEALRQSNLMMKERFEGLSVWREKQREERDFLETRLEEARGRMEVLAAENLELSRKLELGVGGASGGDGTDRSGQAKPAHQRTELDALCAQVARLQAEKNDLVAMNSELQLKAGQGSPDDSFIEIIRVTDEDVENARDAAAGERGGKMDVSMATSRLESEEVTVSHLLQSLRNEAQRAERLQLKLQASEARVAELQERIIHSDSTTQTSLQPEPADHAQPANTGKESRTGGATVTQAHSVSEVENLRSQMMSIFNELQQAQNKLDEAEGMKKGLQDRCREVEQDVATLQAQLVQKQAVQAENERLRLQLGSMQAQTEMEHRKSGEERNNQAQLKEAYTKLFEDYEELKEEKKKMESDRVPKEVVTELEAQLTAAEKALAVKQEHIDTMKQDLFRKEEELETISVFQAQAEVYSSDFYAERAAREKIHEEKERLAAQLDFVKKQNSQLQEEMESLGRHSLNEMQKRHLPHGGNAHGGAGAQGGRVGGDGREWQQQVNIPEHACPKCNEILPDLDSLQIHIMDCII